MWWWIFPGFIGVILGVACGVLMDEIVRTKYRQYIMSKQPAPEEKIRNPIGFKR